MMHTNSPRIRSTAGVLVLAAVSLGWGCASVPAQYRNSSPIALQSGLFRGYTYTHENSAPARVLGTVSYSSSFRELLAQEPEALAEAQRAVPFHYLAGASTLGVAVYSLVSIVNQFNRQANASTPAELTRAGEISTTDIAVTLGLGAVSVVAGRSARSYLLNAVEIFNARSEENASDGAGAARETPGPLPTLLEIDPFGRRLLLGWRF
jgi:hypothetical protein